MDAETGEGLDPKLVRQMLAVGLGIVPVVFDTTIVNIAMHTLSRSLGASLSAIQWVTSGYLLSLAMSIPLSAWLSDRFGGRRAWLWALGLFLAGSVGCGAAWDLSSLVVFRVLQGVGGGILLPVMMTLFARSVAGRGSMGSISAFLMLPAVIGPMLGPVLCGIVLAFLSWRWIFWVNALPCLVSLFLSWRSLPRENDSGAARTPFDLIGFLLVSPGIAALLFGLSRIAHGGAGAAALPWVAVGALLVGAFAVRALRASAPLVDVRLLGISSLRDSLALLGLSSLANYGALFLLPLYFQEARGQSALHAGFFLVAQGAGSLLSRGVAGKLTDRIGPRPVVLAGFLVVLVGTLPLIAIGKTTCVPLIVLTLVVRGFGTGAVVIPLMASSYRDLQSAQVSHASVLVRIAMQLGGAFGTAALAVILHFGLHASAGSAYAQGFAWCAGFAALAALWTLRLPAGRIQVLTES